MVRYMFDTWGQACRFVDKTTNDWCLFDECRPGMCFVSARWKNSCGATLVSLLAENAIGTSGGFPVGVGGVSMNQASAPRGVRAPWAGRSYPATWAKPAKSGGGKLVQYFERASDSSSPTTKTPCRIPGLGLSRTHPIAVTAGTTGGRSKLTATRRPTIAQQLVEPTQEVT